MKNRRFASCLLGLGLLTILGCTPAIDGFTEGVTDGVSAATSVFIEEVTGALLGNVLPEEGG